MELLLLVGMQKWHSQLVKSLEFSNESLSYESWPYSYHETLQSHSSLEVKTSDMKAYAHLKIYT